MAENRKSTRSPKKSVKKKRIVKDGGEKRGYDPPTYRCRYRALLRICYAAKRSPTDVLKEAKYPRELPNLRQGKRFRAKIYEAIAEVLDCDPTCLFYVPQRPDHDVPAHTFARRVEELLNKPGCIPNEDSVTGEKIDVVQYIWQLGDPVINAISLTHQQERHAYILLRDEYQRLIEVPTHTGTKRDRIGRFYRAVIWQEDIIADIEVRRSLAMAAYDTLKKQYERGIMYHIQRIKDELPDRFDHYLATVKHDAMRDVDCRGMFANTKTHPIKTEGDDANYEVNYSDESSDFKNQSGTERTKNKKPLDDQYGYNPSKISEYYADVHRTLVDETSTNKVIAADFFVRKIIFPTHQQDEIFEQCYSRSRSLIHYVMTNEDHIFPGWWFNLRQDNTEYLQKFSDALLSDTPKWEEMKESTNDTIARLIEEIRQYYPPITDTDPLASREDDQ